MSNSTREKSAADPGADVLHSNTTYSDTMSTAAQVTTSIHGCSVITAC